MTRGDEVTLIKEVRETRQLTELLIAALYGKENTKSVVSIAKRHLERNPLDCQVPIWGIGLQHHVGALYEAGYRTLEDFTQVHRGEIARMPGIGRVSMQRIEDAMAEHGLTWAEAS